MSATGALLEVEGLTVEYRTRRPRGSLTAVDSVSLRVDPGEAVGLVGESGSGKSTIARAVLGLAPITGGGIRLSGRDITRASFASRRALARELQVVFQDPTSSLNPSITIGRTLAEPLLAQGVRDRGELVKRVGAMLERVGLPADTARQHPSQFSGGQRQRIAIARALMLEPRLVICDEVLSALDLSVQAQIINLLEELQEERGLSYLFISHDLSVVQHLCARTVVLYRGRVMEWGPTARVASDPRHPYTVALHDAAPLPDPAAQRARNERRPAPLAPTRSPGAGPDPSRRLCPYLDRCPVALDRCALEEPALIEIEDGRFVACHRLPSMANAKGARAFARRAPNAAAGGSPPPA